MSANRPLGWYATYLAWLTNRHFKSKDVLLTVIGQETELVKIAARTLAGLSQRLDTTCAAPVDGHIDELHGWITAWAPAEPTQGMKALAAQGIYSLLGERLATKFFRRPTSPADDRYLTGWTRVLSLRVRSYPG
jgi:hypothetical protein